MLRRYWFIVNPQDRFGPRNIGVSAYSKAEAMELAFATLRKLNLTEYLADFNEHTESIEKYRYKIVRSKPRYSKYGCGNLEGRLVAKSQSLNFALLKSSL